MPEKQFISQCPKNTFIKYHKKIVFLQCCEPILFCAFDVRNKVQFAWAK